MAADVFAGGAHRRGLGRPLGYIIGLSYVPTGRERVE